MRNKDNVFRPVLYHRYRADFISANNNAPKAVNFNRQGGFAAAVAA